MSAYPSQLNYSALADANKLSGSKETLIATPSNGSIFQCGSGCEVTIPMNQPGYVIDLKNSRATVTVKNATGVAISFQSRVGSLGLIVNKSLR